MKNFHEILQRNDYIIGSWLSTGSPVVAELMAACGFDFLTVDVEHSAVDLSQVQVLFQAIQAGNPNCIPLVRLPGHDYATTKRFLDAGALGVIAPLINTVEQAIEVVNAVKYPSQGHRGVGFCRANMYGINLNEATASANDQTIICVQIEHIDGVKNIDKILSVPEIDAVFVGPYDLSASMGRIGQFNHPEVRETLQYIIDKCTAHGVIPGIHVVQPDVKDVAERYKQGYRLMAYSLDITMLAHACQSGMKDIRSQLTPNQPFHIGCQ